jgi:hypothetical protein
LFGDILRLIAELRPPPEGLVASGNLSLNKAVIQWMSIW